MKKQTIAFLLVFVLAGLSGLHGVGHSEGFVFKTPGEISSASVQQEEELPMDAGVPSSVIIAAFFLLIAASGSARLVSIRRAVHLTPVFYEGGYLSVFYKRA
ncbi:hypothetical protein [Salimicrobium flavidum]|uniref:Uncharacterized protein n=1 Tax=Salimicrobium flavidum TaxID=570947 RepID=A0A1N7IRI8_9BACI|nr:hypothetical protein [Salimicrobium flavidum]SIS39698.1 hypothetical protein SAMN05421687_10236 [Salimicrobium flavidum]